MENVYLLILMPASQIATFAAFPPRTKKTGRKKNYKNKFELKELK